MPEANKPRTAPKPKSHRSAVVARWIQNNFAGHVSKTALLNILLLGLTLLLGAIIAAVFFFPTSFDWRLRVISDLTSPRHNPRAYWLLAFGIMTGMLLSLPFAGYVARRLHTITPRLARSARLAFASSFVLMFLSMAAQLVEPVNVLRLHEYLARIATGIFVAGMFCCCASALKDRFRCFGGKVSLPGAVVYYWLSLTLLPVICLAGLGILVFLGHQAGLVWAEDLRQSFRHTPLWKLAFWEWIGAVVVALFLFGSVLLLPASCDQPQLNATGNGNTTRS